MILRGASGKSYQLEGVPFGRGGEGDIYRIINMPGHVVKIYHADRITSELEKKIQVMIRHPPKREMLTQIAWPLDSVYGQKGAFCGFVMYQLNITNGLGDVYFYPPQKNISYKAKLTIAQNICAVISEIHNIGFVFGDFNPRNIGVNLDTCRVAFLDTDSYHIVDGAQTYRCKVCLNGYVAPELIKKCEPYKTDAYACAPLPTFTRETDNFALAIHIFRLLMNGYTPFNGMREDERASAASPGTGNDAIKRNNYCFKPGNKPQAVAVPPLSILPGEIADLFTRAFMDGRIDPAQRPTATEWHKALVDYENTLVYCPNNKAHMYQKRLTACPWCEAKKRYNAAIAPPVPKKATAPTPPQKTFSGAVVPVTSIPNVTVPGTSASGAAVPPMQPVVQPPASPGGSPGGNGTCGTTRPRPPGGSGTTVPPPGSGRGGLQPVSPPGTQGKTRKILLKKIRTAAVIIIVAALATAVGRVIAVANHRSQYMHAETLLEVESYGEAAAAFDELGDYGDAAERTLDAAYRNARTLMEAGNYDEAAIAFEALGNYNDAETGMLDAKYQKAEALLAAGNRPSAAMAFGALGDYLDARERSFALWDEIALRETISVGNDHIIGLKTDGTVVTAGKNSYGECDVESWTDIIAVSTSAYYTAGLKSDGTVVLVGGDGNNKCNVDSWTDIVAVSCDNSNVVGLRSDGTVEAVGYSYRGSEKSAIDSWTDLVAVYTASGYFGLKADGTVVGTGYQDAIRQWTDIVALSVCGMHVEGLRSDGTIVTAGHEYSGELSVGEWKNIVAFASGDNHTVGLKSDGSLVVTGNYGLFEPVESWTDVVAVSAGACHIVGLKANGTAVVAQAFGNELDISGWSAIRIP